MPILGVYALAPSFNYASKVSSSRVLERTMSVTIARDRTLIDKWIMMLRKYWHFIITFLFLCVFLIFWSIHWMRAQICRKFARVCFNFVDIYDFLIWCTQNNDFKRYTHTQTTMDTIGKTSWFHKKKWSKKDDDDQITRMYKVMNVEQKKNFFVFVSRYYVSVHCLRIFQNENVDNLLLGLFDVLLFVTLIMKNNKWNLNWFHIRSNYWMCFFFGKNK